MLPRRDGNAPGDACAQFEGEGDVLVVGPVVAREVREGPGDPEDPVDPPGGEQPALHVALRLDEGPGSRRVPGAQFVAGDLAVDPPGGVGEAGGGAGAGLADAFGDGGGALAPAALAEEVGAGDGFGFDPEVDAVEEGSGETRLVAADDSGGAFAAGAVPGVAPAGAGIGRQGEEEAGGEPDDSGGAGDDDVSGLQGLAEGVECLSREFGSFVRFSDC